MIKREVWLPKVVMVHGLRFAGKGTIADRLCEKWGYSKIKFATPLKNMVRSLLRDAGIPDEEIERYLEGDLKETPIEVLPGRPTSRYLMKTLGVEWRNLISEELFASVAVRRIKMALAAGRRVVIDDFRFMVEDKVVSELDPHRLMVTRKDRGVEEDGHASEAGLDPAMFDKVITNDETVADLHVKVDRHMEAISRGQVKEMASHEHRGWLPGFLRKGAA